MDKTTSEKMKLGVFVIVALLLFVVAVYVIGERQNMFAKTFHISAHFNSVNGLMHGNNVRFSGINVGTVKSISMINDSTVKVDMVIEQNMVKHIKKDAIATITTDGLVGNKIVNIIPGKGKAGVIASGDSIRSYSKIGADNMLNTLSVTNENAALLTAELLEITRAINRGERTLGMLINDTVVAKDIKQTVQNLKIVSANTNRTIQEVNSILNTIDMDESVAGVFLNNPDAANSVKNIISNLNTSSQEINTVINNLNETIINVKEGEGALNYLSNDKELVENLKETIKSVNEGTAKFNENMEAFKHNFLTRGYFKKLERQQKKAAKNSND